MSQEDIFTEIASFHTENVAVYDLLVDFSEVVSLLKIAHLHHGFADADNILIYKRTEDDGE